MGPSYVCAREKGGRSEMWVCGFVDLRKGDAEVYVRRGGRVAVYVACVE